MAIRIWQCRLTDTGVSYILALGGRSPGRREVEIPFQPDEASAREAAARLFFVNAAGQHGNDPDNHLAPERLCTEEAIECVALQ
jgi:hypothetical protein